MNSPSVRVEWPIVSTVVEDSRLGSFFPAGPAGLVLTADGFNFWIILRDTQYCFGLPAPIESFSPSRCGSCALCRIAPNRLKLFLVTEGGVQ